MSFECFRHQSFHLRKNSCSTLPYSVGADRKFYVLAQRKEEGVIDSLGKRATPGAGAGRAGFRSPPRPSASGRQRKHLVCMRARCPALPGAAPVAPLLGLNFFPAPRLVHRPPAAGRHWPHCGGCMARVLRAKLQSGRNNVC